MDAVEEDGRSSSDRRAFLLAFPARLLCLPPAHTVPTRRAYHEGFLRRRLPAPEFTRAEKRQSGEVTVASSPCCGEGAIPGF